MTKKNNSTPRPISTRSWQKTGIRRLYKLVGARKVSYTYKYPDGHSETLASAELGDRTALAKAEVIAKRLALDIQQGQIIANSVAEMIERFVDHVAPTHYLDQSKDGIATRALAARNLKLFFGKMLPASLKTLHGYQYLDARAQAGAPAGANKEMALMSTICHQGVKWGLMERNPFTDMIKNKTETNVRTVQRRQVVRFYLWALRQQQAYRTMGIAAMFSYLTGFRAAEVRPFMKSGIKAAGVEVISAKRKKGENRVTKFRDWSPRLRVVVARALQRKEKIQGVYLFASTRKARAYTRSGWSATWQDAMALYLGVTDEMVTHHPGYFALQDVRPVAITQKMEQRSADVYDFAAHANPSTTHQNYDRRRVKRASATE
ncbi:hypothetical protein [Paralcaligenes ginsengisoli]